MAPGDLYLFWSTIALHFVAVIILTLVFLFYVGQYICNIQKTSSITIIIKSLTVIGSIACIACAIFNGLTVYIDDNKRNLNDPWYEAETISHCFIDIMTYSIYIYRLHLSFHDTSYAISKCTMIILILLVSMDIINFIIECFLQWRINNSNMSWNYLIYNDVVGLVIECIITISCLWLFNIKLLRLIIRMKSSISYLSRSEINNGMRRDDRYHSFNDRQRQLIDRIVRNGLLCSMTIIFWVCQRVVWLVFVYTSYSKYYEGILIAKCVTVITLMVDALCMLFTFRFATGLYKYSCGLCDKCCESVCKSCANHYVPKL